MNEKDQYVVGPYTKERRLCLARERGILVDDEDLWLLEECTWHLNQDGYARARLNDEGNVFVFLHHCIVGYPIREGEEIDHIDRNKTNNHRSNLRYVDHFLQTLNRDFPSGETNARNITRRSDNGKYKVQIYRNKRFIYLGQFNTLDEAVAERDMWLHQHKEYVSSTR